MNIVYVLAFFLLLQGIGGKGGVGGKGGFGGGPSAGGGIAFVVDLGGGTGSGGNLGGGNFTLATISSATSGNVILATATCYWSGGVGTISNLITTNVTWTKAGYISNGSGKAETSVWTGVVAGGASGTTITAASTSYCNEADAYFREFSGMTGTVVQAAVTTNGTTGNSIATGSLTTTTADALIVAAASANSTASASPSGWSDVQNYYAGGAYLNFSAYKNVTATGTFSATWTATNNPTTDWSTVIVGLQ
jgi:hypothetical protein